MMMLKTMTLITLLGLLLLTGCTQQSNQTKLTSDQAYLAMSEDSTIVLVDVRTVAEFREGHIKESINIPIDQLTQQISSVVADKKTTIFVVCRSGNRSAQASDILASLGYQSIVDIGSVFTWPQPLVLVNP
jgi:phage shock protein E